ncbi:histidine phosphatase family protein [Thermodesulfobacteriota bacterium]
MQSNDRTADPLKWASTLQTAPSERTRLYLVRHGELTTSSQWRYVGHRDVELNDNGRRQVASLAERLQHERIDCIFSSDLIRTVASAEILGEQFGLSPIACQEFREINIGHWEGLNLNEIIERFKEEFDARNSDLAGFRIKGGESFNDVRNRVIPKLQACLQAGRCVLAGQFKLQRCVGGSIIQIHGRGLLLINTVKLKRLFIRLFNLRSGILRFELKIKFILRRISGTKIKLLQWCLQIICRIIGFTAYLHIYICNHFLQFHVISAGIRTLHLVTIKWIVNKL